jgi:protein-S-isoprenylcysteine O-methyltransferase Ste14
LEVRLIRTPSRRFDPFALLERAVSPAFAHRVVRAVVLAFLVIFLAHRLGQYHAYLFKPLWAAETLVYVVFIVAYAMRVDPKDRSRGVREVLVPLVGAVLPFALLQSRPLPWVVHRPVALYALFSSMTFFTAFTVWGLWSLRSSFSITVEARRLVQGGAYRRVRHPVYLGEMLTAVAVAVWRASAANAVLLVLFIVIQFLRARWEEEKLARVFPEYRPYAGRAWWPYPPRKGI